MSSKTISLIQPDDWHLHLRDNEALQTTVAHSAKGFARAVVMPNLPTPVTTVAAALDYRDRIIAAIPVDKSFDPLMTLYLTDTTPLAEIDKISRTESVVAVKYYPAGATTNSEFGLSSVENAYPVLERMAELGIPLLVHGEVTDEDIDIFDREQKFIETILEPLLNRYPTLRVVLEHITTSEAVDFVAEQPANVAATITVHHLLYNRNHLLAGGVRPHFYCLPILKRDSHQQALIAAAIGGNPKYFLGTDSAPHAKAAKLSSCGCAGIYSAPAAIELYADVFEQQDALEMLEAFASFHGPDFYSLPRNQTRIQLCKSDWQMAAEFSLGGDTVVPIQAGETLNWQILQGSET